MRTVGWCSSSDDGLCQTYESNSGSFGLRVPCDAAASLIFPRMYCIVGSLAVIWPLAAARSRRLTWQVPVLHW